MAINVIVERKGKKLKFRGEQFEIQGNMLKIGTEPHEVKPEGVVDVFIGKLVPLMDGDIVEVLRV